MLACGKERRAAPAGHSEEADRAQAAAGMQAGAHGREPGTMQAIRRQIARHLSARLLLRLGLLLVVSTAVFLVAFFWLYHAQLRQERAFASRQVSMLFEAALENAMIKRDLSGLRRILRRFGRQPDVHGVMLANPKGEIRFASHARLLRRPVVRRELAACRPACDGGWPPRAEYARFFEDPLVGPVLRTVKPIRNRPVCTPCHGPLARHPVNGVLIADFDARAIRQQAALGAAGLAGAGALVTALVLAAAWRFVHVDVLVPVHRLAAAAERLARGDLSARVPVTGEDELGRLAAAFNRMAERLQALVERLRAHDAYLQALIDTVPDGIRVIGPDRRIRLANRAYREQIAGSTGQDDGAGEDGTTPTLPDPVGQPCHLSAHGRTEPCPHSLVTCPLEAFREGGGEPLRLMHAHVRADGRRFPVEIVAAPLREPDGGIAVVEAIRDLSRQMDITQEQRLAELGQLATGVAHEIHNPLASVRLGLQALQRALARGCPPAEIEAYLEKVDAAVDQCIDVTGRMLRLSLPPSDRPELVDLAEVARDTMALLRFEAERQGVDMQVKAPDPVRILGHESEMRMLLLNLVQNAFHAMPQGGRLEVTVRRRGDQAELIVSDTGVGMEAEVRRHIFDPFFSRRADGRRGTGLGLTICRSIVERHEGRIEVESAPGQGTAFVIHLPLAERRLARDDHAPMPEHTAPASEKEKEAPARMPMAKEEAGS